MLQDMVRFTLLHLTCLEQSMRYSYNLGFFRSPCAVQIEVLLEQCTEPDFSAEVAAEGGDDGAESLRVCLAVARALNERLSASLKVNTTTTRPATDPSDLVPLPMPQSKDAEFNVEADEGVDAQAVADTSSDEELPVGEVDATAEAKVARQRRMETFGASC